MVVFNQRGRAVHSATGREHDNQHNGPVPTSHDPLHPLFGPFDGDSTPLEVESVEELAVHLAKGSLAGLTVQGLTVDDGLTAVDLTGTLFVGCRFPSLEAEAELVRRGAHVMPPFEELPYPTHPSHLYRPEELAAGFAERGFAGMYDTVVYEHFVRHGGAAPDLREALAQRLHDAGIDNALADALTTWVRDHGTAGRIGKYFSNAVREDSILRLSRGGIVFAPGRAGTVQEVFQAATKTFYATDGPSGPFVFLDTAHWSALPAAALLRPLLAASPHGDQSHLIVVTDSVEEAVVALS